MVQKLIFQSYHAADESAWNKKLDCYRPIDDLAELSKKRMKAYAELIGADYLCIDRPVWDGVRKHPAWTRWYMFTLASRYDQLCYVDCDVLPTKFAFENRVSIFDTEGTAKLTEREDGSREAWHVNAGVFKVTQQEAFRLNNRIHDKKYVKWLAESGKNQEAFNDCWYKTFRKKPKHFGTNWNATRPYHREGEYYFHHYIGAQKTETGNGFGNLYTGGVYAWNMEEEAKASTVV